MLRVTDDILELRQWAEERGGRPCRHLDGRVGLCFGPDLSDTLPVGWDEFETNFLIAHDVVAYDDAPGATCCFIGTEREARDHVARYVDSRSRGVTAPAP